MDIVERLRNNKGGESYTWQTISEAADTIERLRGVLQQIADIEHEDIPTPKTPNEGTTWTVLAMAIGLAEKALKEGELWITKKK